MDPLSNIQLNLDQGALFAMNVALAVIMYSVAIAINIEDIKEVLANPKGIFAGVTSQFLFLPFLTFLFVLVANPLPGLALGLILVAACPGGNISNFFTLRSKGNVALSVSLTILATLLAPIMTPLNFEFWGGQIEYLQPILKTIHIDFFELVKTVTLIMVVPLILGILTNWKYPLFVKKISRPLQILSMLILLGFIVAAFTKNTDKFLAYYHYVIYLVFFHNAVALLFGYFYGRFITKKTRDAKTISVETGIQNSGLGLVIILTFFPNQGGMAIVAAWWGIWHIISGFVISFFYRRWVGVSTNT